MFSREARSGWSVTLQRDGERVAVVGYGSMEEGGLRLVAGLPHDSRSILYLCLIDRRESIASRVHFKRTSSAEVI
jgi:hypothetical protein